ncbi:MAG: hypothetical protein EXS55_00905 [Candidatus Magasanikbacteria bacterium]|nr:hypothetical protein [Candidatus Magasanikbacteria bacterium]
MIIPQKKDAVKSFLPLSHSTKYAILNLMNDPKLEPQFKPTPEQPSAPRTEILVTPKRETAESKDEATPLEIEKEKSTVREISEMIGGLLPGKRRPRPTAIPQVRDGVTVKIEKIMEDGVGDAFSRLSPVAREEFKLKGEETARAIRLLLQNTHIKVKKIFELILNWLRMLPGINRFFLEQEAKIKTDRIIAIHDKEIGKLGN